MQANDLKIRVHELAGELDISERTLINWLSRKGYPGARGKDWLTPHLARNARNSLQRSGNKKLNQGQGRSATQPPRFTQRLSWSNHEQFDHLPSQQDYPSTTSLATNLQEADLQDNPTIPLNSGSDRPPSHDELVQRERDRSALLLKRLEGLRVFHEQRYQDLQWKYEHTVDERTELRQKLHAQRQNQETLDQTCRELSHELEHNRREVSELKQHLQAQEQMSKSIDRVNQQKQAWRARALALEEQVQSNQQLGSQLKELGMSTLDQQVRLFQTLLASPESANQLFKAIKMVEHEQVKKMVNRWVVKTCAHPLCNQVNTLRKKLSYRVHRAHRCEVCKGNPEQRWFQRMVAGCERAQIKRFLLIGGEKLHPRIRELTEGQHVDFRLIPSTDESSPQRIQGRLESCDLLITWPRGALASDAGLAYRSLAPTVDCPLIDLNGDLADIATLSRQILNRVSRVGP
ncbi:MAG: hypothetical protein CMH49_00655 [Myxococcales bacterium]|nr:hypothetical protein [Myxococcales bacterium]